MAEVGESAGPASEPADADAPGDPAVHNADLAGEIAEAARVNGRDLHAAWIKTEQDQASTYARQYVLALQYRYQYDKWYAAQRAAGIKHPGGCKDFILSIGAELEEAAQPSDYRAERITTMGCSHMKFIAEGDDYDETLRRLQRPGSKAVDLDPGSADFDAETAIGNMLAYFDDKRWTSDGDVFDNVKDAVTNKYVGGHWSYTRRARCLCAA